MGSVEFKWYLLLFMLKTTVTSEKVLLWFSYFVPAIDAVVGVKGGLIAIYAVALYLVNLIENCECAEIAFLWNN